jgi:hypothetical protein
LGPEGLFETGQQQQQQQQQQRKQQQQRRKRKWKRGLKTRCVLAAEVGKSEKCEGRLGDAATGPSYPYLGCYRKRKMLDRPEKALGGQIHFLLLMLPLLQLLPKMMMLRLTWSLPNL